MVTIPSMKMVIWRIFWNCFTRIGKKMWLGFHDDFYANIFGYEHKLSKHLARCDTLHSCLRNIWDVSDVLKWLSWPHGRCSCRKRLRLSWPDGYVRQIAGYNTGEDDARAWAVFEILWSTGRNRNTEEEEPLTRARMSIVRVCLSRRTRPYFQVARNLRRSTCMHVFWVHPFSSRRDRRQREQSMLPCNPESRRPCILGKTSRRNQHQLTKKIENAGDCCMLSSCEWAHARLEFE